MEKQSARALKLQTLTSSQQLAFEKLRYFHRLHACGIRDVAGFFPRPSPLIVGPSGSGKSFLVQRLAEAEGLSLFSMNIQSWIPLGAKRSPATLEQLISFIRSHQKSIVFIDELNKLNTHHVAESGWSSDIFCEVLALLDKDARLKNMGFDGTTIERMKQNCMFIGAGAFQDEWRGSQASTAIGFVEPTVSAEDREKTYQRLILNQSIVPDELLFRFNAQLVLLSPPTRLETEETIRKIRQAIKLPDLPDSEMQSLVVAAQSSGKMMRWFEMYVSKSLENAPKMLKRAGSKSEETEAQGLATHDETQMDSKPRIGAAYTDAFSIYTMRLCQLSEAAGALQVLVQADLYVPHRNYDEDPAVMMDLQQAFRDQLGDPKVGLPEMLSIMAIHALEIGCPSKDDQERAKLAIGVDVLSRHISFCLKEHLAELNLSVRDRGMVVITAFLDAARKAQVEYKNVNQVKEWKDELLDIRDWRVRWLFSESSA